MDTYDTSPYFICRECGNDWLMKHDRDRCERSHQKPHAASSEMLTDEMVETALETYATAMLRDVDDYRNERAWQEARDSMHTALVAALNVAPTVDAVWCEHTKQVRAPESTGRWWCDPMLSDCPGPHRTLLLGPDTIAPRPTTSDQ